MECKMRKGAAVMVDKMLNAEICCMWAIVCPWDGIVYVYVSVYVVHG